MSHFAPFEMPHHQTSSYSVDMERRSQATQQPSQINAEAVSLSRLGREAMDAGRYESAVNYFERALHLQPQCYGTWYCQGDALANLQRYPEALACFEQAIALCPSYGEAWTFQAVILLYLHRYADAIVACDRALAINSKDAEAWTFRGAALQRLGRYEQAYANYDVATGSVRRSWWQLLKQLLSRILKLFQIWH